MRKDKRLQEYANKSMEQYNNPEIFEQLKQHIKPKEKKEAWYERISRKTWYAVGGSFATVAIVAVVLLCVFLIEPGILSLHDTNTTPNATDNPTDIPTATPKKEYFGYILVGNSSTQKVNQYTEALDLTEIDLVYVKEHTDSHYGDILYFSMGYYNEETLDNVVLNVVTNQDYNYVFLDSTNWNKTTYRGYELVYNEAFEEDEGIYFFTVNAILKTDKENITIYYEGVSLEETSNFISALDQIFVQ